MPRATFYAQLTAAVAAQEQLIRETAEYLYQHPELALKEHRAAAFLTEQLGRAGFTVTAPVAGLETAFSARLTAPGGEAGPTFALIAEYDALPGIGHGCGHNLIAASVLGAAVALAETGLVRRGSLVVMGTPAEEASGGKIPMLAAGAFAGIDASVMLHPEVYTAVAADALACAGYAFTFHGRAAHAAGDPREGINALDAVIQTFNNVNALRQRLRGDAKVHGIITRGGEAANIIPHCCQAQFTIRSARGEDLAWVEEEVKNAARGAAVALGAELEIARTEDVYLDMRNDPALTDACRSYLELAGFADIMEGDPFPGSTDYGNVSQAVPSSYGFFAIGGTQAALHTAEFAAATVTPTAIASTCRAAVVLGSVAAEILAGESGESGEYGESGSPG